MNKHAYLIMAHGNWDILKKLLILIDDEKNDIYLHIDAKANLQIIDDILPAVKISKVTLIDSQEVYWADYSIVEVELKLLKAANNDVNGGGYSYYHLLSGVDLPIKSNGEIYSYFESSGKNFIGIVPNEVYYSVRRVKFYHPFTQFEAYRNSKLLKGIDRLLEYIQKAVGINRIKNINWKIIDGWQWFSITEEFCNYLLENEVLIKKIFSRTISCDELVLQTLAYNSEFYNTLNDTMDLKNGSMRYIDWQRGKPYVWGKEEQDYEMLMNSPYMFARKFDESHMDIVDKIYNELMRRKNDE